MVPAPVAAADTVTVVVPWTAPAASSSATAHSSPFAFCLMNASAMMASIEPAPNFACASAAPPTRVGSSAATLPAARRWPIRSERNSTAPAPARPESISA